MTTWDPDAEGGGGSERAFTGPSRPRAAEQANMTFRGDESYILGGVFKNLILHSEIMFTMFHHRSILK